MSVKDNRNKDKIYYQILISKQLQPPPKLKNYGYDQNQKYP